MNNHVAVIIPYAQLSEAALQGVIEEFITRESTDYGEIQILHAVKIMQIKNQLQLKKAFIVFDQTSKTCTILHKNDPVVLKTIGP